MGASAQSLGDKGVAMAIELGESLLEDMLGVNSSSDSDEEIVHMGDCRASSLGDEFFHSKSEYGVSEYHACKRLLYSTVGDSHEKVWDIFLLLPSFIFLAILGYSSPRTRHQLAKVSILPKTLHILILTGGLDNLQKHRILVGLVLPPLLGSPHLLLLHLLLHLLHLLLHLVHLLPTLFTCWSITRV